MGCLMVVAIIFAILIGIYVIDWILVGAAMWIVSMALGFPVNLSLITAAATVAFVIQVLFCNKRLKVSVDK